VDNLKNNLAKCALVISLLMLSSCEVVNNVIQGHITLIKPNITTLSCPTNVNEANNYNCDIDSSTFGSLTYQMASTNTCTWVKASDINPSTGVVSATPNDDDVGNCTLAVQVIHFTGGTTTKLYSVTVDNLAPTIVFGSPARVAGGDPPTVIMSDVAVDSSNEGYGVYSIDDSATPAPKCFDNGTPLDIDSDTGEITFSPDSGFFGLCNVGVLFDDQNGASGLTTEQFNILIDADETPADFSSPPALNATYNTLILLDPTLITSIATDVDISVTGSGSPEYQVCTNPSCSSVKHTWQTSLRTGGVSPGDYVQVKFTSSSLPSTLTESILKVGETSGTFSITTEPADASTDPLSKHLGAGVALSSML